MDRYKKSSFERRGADLFGTSFTATTPSNQNKKKSSQLLTPKSFEENTHHPVNICIAKPGLLSNALSAFQMLS